MPVDVRSDKLTQLVDENVEIEQLGTGFTFTEGPIWHPRDEYLHHRGQLYAFLRQFGIEPPMNWDFEGSAPAYQPKQHA